jgi:hypothetical protein
MITLFCVRPKGVNLGNEVIFLGLSHLLREAFGTLVNIAQVPAEDAGDGALYGLTASSVHEMNQYGHGVIVGGGNLYENGQLRVDANALSALRPPLMLFSLSYGRIYDHLHQLVRRTDAMPDAVVAALNAQAAVSIARDDATMVHLRAIGIDRARLGACPTLFLDSFPVLRPQLNGAGGALIAIRHPSLMNLPLRHQARLHDTVRDIARALEEDGFGSARILCHDIRDASFAASLGDMEFVLPEDAYTLVELLRRAPLVVSFRLHAFLPCVSAGTPAINISYDERSHSLLRTIGLDRWDIDFVRTPDVAAAVRDRAARLGDLDALRSAARPIWRGYEQVLRDGAAEFTTLVRRYATGSSPADG